MKKKIFAGVALVVLIGVGGYIYWSGNAGKEESASSATFFTEELEQADTYDQPSKPVAVEAEVGRPVFDIVRVEPDGSMVAAGRGIPNDTLSLMDGENVLASVSVDDRGEWVYIPSDPLIVGTHELWLKNDEVRSREEAEIVVVEGIVTNHNVHPLPVMESKRGHELTTIVANNLVHDIVLDLRSLLLGSCGIAIVGAVVVSSDGEAALVNSCVNIIVVRVILVKPVASVRPDLVTIGSEVHVVPFCRFLC